MAAAEARAAWQRTANRCFVQEDAKRAPKLACCQSSSTSTEVESAPINPSDQPDHPSIGFMPINRNPSYSSLPPDTRWWLQMQPDSGYYKGLIHDQQNLLEVVETEPLKPKKVNPALPYHPQKAVSSVFTKKMEVKKEDGRTLYCTKGQEFLNRVDANRKYDSMEMDEFESKAGLKHPKEFDFDLDSRWLGGGDKTEPWWRTSDRDDLASLVAQRSLDRIENCDLPPPQERCMRRNPCAPKGSCNEQDWTFVSPLDLISEAGSISSMSAVHGHGGLDLVRKQGIIVEQEHLSKNTEESFSSDTSKSELMDALRHSQTRAREAENAAKKANAEKEHIIQLFFKQASQLFAYKQWLQLLQLETLYIQIKNGNNEKRRVSASFPAVLPWMSSSYRGRKYGKSGHRYVRGKRAKRARGRRCDFSRYVVALALGLSLVGAGLFLGWTVGWMLPSF